MVFKGTYDPFIRALNGTLETTYPGSTHPPRIDQFRLTLPDDDVPTAWQRMTSVRRENGTCPGDVKFQRVPQAKGGRMAGEMRLTRQTFLGAL